jgi:hypothetical protein
MSAGFFKRATSTVIDMIIVFAFIYLTFALIGKPLLQKRVENFDEVFSSYSIIIAAYNDDLTAIQTEYNANMEIADGDSALEAAAKETYQTKLDMLNQQNDIDVGLFNIPLTLYFLSIIYYFVVGFIALMTIYTLIIKGKTLGRKLMRVKMEGNINLLTVFFHDIILKYFFFIIILLFGMYYGFVFFMLSLMIDLILITFTKNKSTIRDMMFNIKIVNANQGY